MDRIEYGTCYAINFLMADDLGIPPFAFKTKSAIHYAECFKTAEFAWRTQSCGAYMICKAQLYAIIAAMQSEYGMNYTATESAEMIRPAIAYIHENYSGSAMQMAELARLCGISESYFRRIFHKSMGCSPIQYIRDLRITCAKELLRSGMYTVSAVAALSGFHDDCYFSREFKKAVGVTPFEYSSRCEM